MRRFALIRGACFLKPWRNRAQSVSDGQIESYVVNRRHTNYELLATGNWRLNTSHKPQATSDQRPATRSAGTIAQKYLIMQNKPNLLNAQMNISTAVTMYYVNIRLRSRFKNKANQSQFKPNSNPIKANSNPIKANSNPILSQMRRKQTQSNPISNPIKANSNPIKANSNPILSQMRRKQTQSNPILNPSRAAVPQF